MVRTGKERNQVLMAEWNMASLDSAQKGSIFFYEIPKKSGSRFFVDQLSG